jgi:hypothetical protein
MKIIIKVFINRLKINIMKTNIWNPAIMLVVMLTISITSYSQQLPSGGYQGGTHGNVKYTLWSGAVNDDWADPGNWCPAVVPNENADVMIPASADIMPEVKSNGLTCKSLTVQPGADVTIKTGYTLTVNGQQLE